MDEQQNSDTQTSDTDTPAPVKPGGQVMDVKAPNRQIEVADASSEDEPTTDSTPENEGDTPAEPGDTPEVTSESEGEEAESESTEPAPETEESPEIDEPEYAPVHEPEAAEASPEPATGINVTEDSTSGPTPEVPATEDASAEPSADGTQQPTKSLATPHMPAKGNPPVIAIVVAIIVAIALAGLVIFTYMKGKNAAKLKGTPSTAASSQTVVSKPQASASDVDTTNQEIDTSLQKANDTTDFPAADLSDTSLGL